MKTSNLVVVDYLILGAEDMGIVLLETSYSRQTAEGARQFIAMKHAKVSHPQRQLSPRAWTSVKDQAETSNKNQQSIFKFVILYAKHYIFSAKCKRERLSLNSFKKMLKSFMKLNRFFLSQ